jgi:hypothetical protein
MMGGFLIFPEMSNFVSPPAVPGVYHNTVIDTVRAQHPAKMDALGRMTQELEFGRMLHLVRAAYGQTSPETGDA